MAETPETDPFDASRWPERPSIEHIRDGDAVFVRAVLERHSGGISLSRGEPYVGVLMREPSGLTSISNVSASLVTKADGYTDASTLRNATHRLERAERDLSAILAAIDAPDALDKIRAILIPAPEVEDDDD